MKAKPQKTKSQKTNQVRIIGGQHKRRLISFVDADGLRPTPDRLRETIFNWLIGRLQDARVLDTCAGSGVLGFESLSRGAGYATLIEYQKDQALQLKQTAQLLNLTVQTQILQGDAVQILGNLTQPFDLIFLDPPYAKNLWQTLLEQIFKHRLCHADSLIYLESDQPLEDVVDNSLLARLAIEKSTKVGQAHAYLLSICENHHEPC